MTITIFATQSGSIPLSELDSNFTTPITIGSTAIALGQTATTLAGVTFASSCVFPIIPVSSGGTGTATPNLVAGTNITISGTWPNQTINATGGGGSLTGTTTTTTTLLGIGATAGSGTGCTMIGTSAGYASSGSYNLGIGTGTLTGTTGGQNTAIGANCGQTISSGSYNTVIGYGAVSSTDVTGHNNLVIGSSGQVSSTSISNETTIFNGLAIARFQGAASSWSFVSDQRDKANIENLSLGLDFINKLQPRVFEWDFRHTETDKGKKSSGFIAQEVLDLMQSENAMYTQLVNTDDENQYTLAQPNLIPMLVNAIKELTDRLEVLESKNV